MDPSLTTFRVKRKPVGSSSSSQPPPLEQVERSPYEDRLSAEASQLAISTPLAPENNVQKRVSLRPSLPPRSRSPLSGDAKSPGRVVQGSYTFGPSTSTPAPNLDPSRTQTWSSSPASSSQPGASQSKAWQAALNTTRDLALRLVPQNTTSTKHYTILLHSSPLIIYRGPKTNIALTVFSSPSHPLPPPESRTLHLQPRGYSGDAGSRLKAFMGLTDSWVDVTPAVRVPAATDVDPSVAKRWEKDIARATKRLAKHAGKHGAHVARETHVVRIPAAAKDGYFRVVLCHTEIFDDKNKHKVLCAGPMVRIASLSSDVSRFRGAKLRTLPIEAGIQVATMLANNAVGNLVGPVVEQVQGKIDQYRPGFAATTAGELAYGATVGDKVSAVGEKVDQAREEHYRTIDLEDSVARGEVDVVGPEEGPEAPFPIKFTGKVIRGSGKSTERLGIPTANLGDIVPEDIKFRLKGVYFGWARVREPKGSDPPPEEWHEAIVSVGPSPYASPSVVQKTVVAVHLLHSFEEHFFDAKVQVIVMGFLRPTKPPGTPDEDLLDAITQDVWLAMSSLSRQNWGPDGAVERIKAVQSRRSFSDRYVGVREKAQARIDRLPAHWVGVRTAGGELRDQAHGNGGYWIAR